MREAFIEGKFLNVKEFGQKGVAHLLLCYYNELTNHERCGQAPGNISLGTSVPMIERLY